MTDTPPEPERCRICGGTDRRSERHGVSPYPGDKWHTFEPDTTPAVEPFTAEEARDRCGLFDHTGIVRRVIKPEECDRVSATLRAYADMLDAQATPAEPTLMERAREVAEAAYDACDHIPPHERESNVREMLPFIARFAADERERVLGEVERLLRIRIERVANAETNQHSAGMVVGYMNAIGMIDRLRKP